MNNKTSHRRRRAKIVATVGPASADAGILAKLFEAGVDTFRLNFSHGEHGAHEEVFRALRKLETQVGCPIGILQDLQGPKVRIGKIRDGRRELRAGESVRFVYKEEDVGERGIHVPHEEVFQALLPGSRLLIDDGKVRLRIERLGDGMAEAVVIAGGCISDKKGLSLPDCQLKLSCLTEKDRVDLDFGLHLGVDWVALSFVQRPSDLIEARALIGNRAGLMAKIEKPSALDHIDDIIQLSDAVMIARGDLGVEIPPEDVPGQQKELIAACRRAATPVVVATQMLESMTVSISPTRAEASDVATAIYDGADAVMLSAESATGAYPLESVEIMDRIIQRTEAHPFYRWVAQMSELSVEMTAPHAVAEAAASMAEVIRSPAIAAFTHSGATAARIARKRPTIPIVAITPIMSTLRRMTLLWGVQGVLSSDIASYDEMVRQSSDIALSNGFAVPGEHLVVVAGVPFAQAGTTNNLRVVQIR